MSSGFACSSSAATRLPFSMISFEDFQQHDAAEPHAAARVGAAADLDDVGVAGDEPHLVDRHAEPFVEQLREARLVALAVRDGADDDIDLAFRHARSISARSRGMPVAVST